MRSIHEMVPVKLDGVRKFMRRNSLRWDNLSIFSQSTVQTLVSALKHALVHENRNMLCLTHDVMIAGGSWPNAIAGFCRATSLNKHKYVQGVGALALWGRQCRLSAGLLAASAAELYPAPRSRRFCASGTAVVDGIGGAAKGLGCGSVSFFSR